MKCSIAGVRVPASVLVSEVAAAALPAPMDGDAHLIALAVARAALARAVTGRIAVLQ